MYYVAHGSLPRQRHTQHRGPDGSLYAEELFGVEGFSGRNSIPTGGQTFMVRWLVPE